MDRGRQSNLPQRGEWMEGDRVTYLREQNGWKKTRVTYLRQENRGVETE